MDYRQREEALADLHVFEPGEWRRGQGLSSELTETPFRRVLSAMALAARERGGPLGLVGQLTAWPL